MGTLTDTQTAPTHMLQSCILVTGWLISSLTAFLLLPRPQASPWGLPRGSRLTWCMDPPWSSRKFRRLPNTFSTLWFPMAYHIHSILTGQTIKQISSSPAGYWKRLRTTLYSLWRGLMRWVLLWIERNNFTLAICLHIQPKCFENECLCN